MKLTTLALAAIVGLFAANASAQTVIYDTVSPATSLTYYSGTGNNQSGDNFLPVAPPAGMVWNITDVDFLGVALAAGTYNVTINVYNTVGALPNPTDPAFSNLAGTTSGTVTIPAGTFPAAFGITVSGLSIPLAATPGVPANGYAVEFVFSGAPNFSTAYVNVGSSITGSSWSNGFFVNLSNTGTMRNNEFVNFSGWTNGNVAYSLTANAVSPIPGPVPSFKKASEPTFTVHPLGPVHLRPGNLVPTTMKSLLG